jgi:hypothetical protein
MPKWLVRVELPWACFGYDVNDQGRVILAAPIAKWMVGKQGAAMVHYWRRRGAQVTWQRHPKGVAA